MTGWRLGYGVWPKPLVEHVRKLITVDHSCVNGVAQMAGLAAITGPQDAVQRMRQSFAERRDVVVKGLNRLPDVSCRTPGGAFYAFPNVSGTGWNGARPHAPAARGGLRGAGAGRKLRGQRGRLSCGSPTRRACADIEEALARMALFLVTARP